MKPSKRNQRNAVAKAEKRQDAKATVSKYASKGLEYRGEYVTRKVGER